MYYNFPKRQKWVPTVEYPLWDKDWDGREEMGKKSKSKVTRHIILVRHGQYDETHRSDSLRILTPLGRSQAHTTGLRISSYLKGLGMGSGGKCSLKAVHSSNMARAKETADIIVRVVEGETGVRVNRTEPDPDINEGRPCHYIPSRKAQSVESVDRDMGRIERGFRRYFYRHVDEGGDGDGEGGGDVELERKIGTEEIVERSKGWLERKIEEILDKKVPPSSNTLLSPYGSKSPTSLYPSPSSNPQSDATTAPPPHNHEFEIVVCHGNVIRYMFLRALQMPPEAWLRLCTFNCSLTYLVVRPSGTVSARTMGDIGHLDGTGQTFSKHEGFNW